MRREEVAMTGGLNLMPTGISEKAISQRIVRDVQ